MKVTFQRPNSRPYFSVASSIDALVSSLLSCTACNLTRFPFILVEGSKGLSWFSGLVGKSLCLVEGNMEDSRRALEAMGLDAGEREARQRTGESEGVKS